MTGSNEVLDPQQVYLQCERRHIYALLMCAGGYMGAFTYLLRGGVFCNAQTANFVLMSIGLNEPILRDKGFRNGYRKEKKRREIPMGYFFGRLGNSDFVPFGTVTRFSSLSDNSYCGKLYCFHAV